jgi:hypothetical protein
MERAKLEPRRPRRASAGGEGAGSTTQFAAACSITGSGKSVDVKAFKISPFCSMRRQYTSRTL